MTLEEFTTKEIQRLKEKIKDLHPASDCVLMEYLEDRITSYEVLLKQYKKQQEKEDDEGQEE